MDANAKQIATYFGMTNAELLVAWKTLAPEDKEFFRVEVGKELNL